MLHILLHLAAWLLGLRDRLGLGSAYLGALAALVVLYPACRWYRGYQVAHPTGWTRCV